MIASQFIHLKIAFRFRVEDELLKRLLAGLGNPAHKHGLLLPEEVMRMLRISERTLRRYNEQGVLTPLTIGGMRYYLMTDIIESGKRGVDGCQPL